MPRRRRIPGGTGLLALLCVLQAAAFVEESAEVSFHGRSYAYRFTAVLDAPLDAVSTVVTDYDRLARLNDSITESRELSRSGEHALRRLLALRQCLLLFCFDMRFVEDVVIAPEEKLTVIRTAVVPAESSFRDGVAEWRLEALSSSRSRMTLSATQTPDFWIPPVIGPLVLQRVFVREVRETTGNIERLAAAIAP